MRRIALAVCPRGERPWLEALLGELGAVEGAGPRLSWLLGAAWLLVAANASRGLALFEPRLRFALPITLAATLLSAWISRNAAEQLGADDDVFVGLTLFFGVTAAGLGALLVVAARGPRFHP